MDIVYLPGVLSLSLPAEFAAVGVAWRELFGWRQDKLSFGIFFYIRDLGSLSSQQSNVACT